MTWIYFLKKKSEVFENFLEFKALVENKTDKRIKVMRTDNEGEFYEKEFKQFCKQHGIVRQNTTHYTPQQNGVAERMNKRVMDKARIMLSDAGLLQDYLEEATNTTCYLVNRSSMLDLVDETPYEALYHKNPSLTNLKVFGCDAFVHITKKRRKKFDNKLEKCTFVRYKYGIKGYKIWNPTTKIVVYSRDVIFR